MNKKKFKTALVIGAGAFGTSIANVLAQNFNKVCLLGRSVELILAINERKENVRYLPGQFLSENIKAYSSWDELNKELKFEVELVIFGLPTTAITAYLYEYLQNVEFFLKREVPIVSLAKGIDPVTLELPDDLFLNFLSPYQDFITFLSGPSFAKEIVDKQITLVSLAGRSKNKLITISEMLETSYFKVLPHYDVKGALLGGALKNILAIAGGIIEQLGFNYNTRAAMITRGIVEMLRFGRIFNARPETFYGLSGMGDLILTTTGGLSRNKSFGMEIAKGRKADDIIRDAGYVIEGYKTTLAAYRLCEKYEIKTRIFNAVYEILYNNKNPKDIIEYLMKTPTKFEFE